MFPHSLTKLCTWSIAPKQTFGKFESKVVRMRQLWVLPSPGLGLKVGSRFRFSFREGVGGDVGYNQASSQLCFMLHTIFG